MRKATLGQPVSHLFLLAVFFFFGILIGRIFACRISDRSIEQLSRYLRDYVTVAEMHSLNGRKIAAVVLIYLRYSCLAVLMGFTSIGILLLPCLSLWLGAVLSFSVSCFAVAFGPESMLLSLAILGMRAIVTVPCFFAVAVPALKTSLILSGISFGRRARPTGVIYDRVWWKRIFTTNVILLLGAGMDLLCSPRFLQWTLEHFL